MDKKQLIERIRNFDKNKAKLQNINSKIEYVKNYYIGCSSKDFDNMGIKSGRVYSSSVENEILAKEKELELLETKRNKLEYELKVLECALNSVKADEVNKIILEKYLLKKEYSLERLSEQMHLDIKTICKKKNKILETINWLIE